MNSDEYRNLGIKLLKRRKFDMAKACFSLAYEASASDELLSFIELCEVAKSNADDVMGLFDIYIGTKTSDQTSNIQEIINLVTQSDQELNEKIDYEDAITYLDFKELVKNSGDFKAVFSSIIFSTRVVITNKDDLLEFVENLIKNGYKEMGLNYLESSANIFLGDVKIEKIIKDLGLKNENSAR
ncbi:hypothetical protein CIG2463D_0112 [Campylobacter iguaniorum]|uniref:Uncharacterized protein n=1 Tax=Campylobacter iguaniorum TaxID=1244531 RepID=A0A076F8G9_9BACT|nr:hypothetical protein [Campylobacter iguaniorum]AII13988.1 hypothetical protein CIG1485E_0109 [Campylobacter iguaniorum]ALV23726.1 hypothetical protein CIG2463D_0112 [Campylobacter iguaniorum]